VLLLAALAVSGCGDPEAEVARPPPLAPLELGGEHQLLRKGTSIQGACAARRGALTAFAVIEQRTLRLLTSSSPALEEPSFSAGPPLAAFNGGTECALVATDSGFAVAWTGETAAGNGVFVQRLAEDGTALGDVIPVASSELQRITLQAEGSRIHVGRVVVGEGGREVWLDSVEGGDVKSELIDSCEIPSLPVVLPGNEGPDLFYTCSREDGSELTLSSVRDGARAVQVLSLGDRRPIELPLAVLDRGQDWAVVWPSARGLFPAWLTIDKVSLEVGEQALGSGERPSNMDVWSLDLLLHGDEPLLRASLCAEVDLTVECWTEICSQPAGGNAPTACMRLEVSGASLLLPGEESATIGYFELGADGVGDLFSAAVVASAPPQLRSPSPVLGPGPLEPLELSCIDGACSLFGRESGSRIVAPEHHRYGFWGVANTGDTSTRAGEFIAFEADGRVLNAGFWDWDWSVASAFRAQGVGKLAVFVDRGLVLDHELTELGEPLALFREDVEGSSRYRLMEGVTTVDGSAIDERLVDELGVGERRRVAEQSFATIGRCDVGYFAVDAERKIYGYDPAVDAEFVVRGKLPVRGAAGSELLRCAGQRVYGLIHSLTGMRLYREQDDGSFREWVYGDVEADQGLLIPPPNGPFGATAGKLRDGRVVFAAHPANAFEASLVAFVIGEGEPEVFALGRPEASLINFAALPALGPADTIWFAWTDMATRSTTLSHWALPSP
jgi:hypothetical protein